MGLDDEVPADANETGRKVLDAAFRVHRSLGPGLLENVYSHCLAHALRSEGLSVEREVRVSVTFEGEVLPAGLRMDMLVEGRVVVEVKAVEALHAVHEAQILSYLKLGRKPLGYLINFHVPRLHQGIRRFAMTRHLT